MQAIRETLHGQPLSNTVSWEYEGLTHDMELAYTPWRENLCMIFIRNTPNVSHTPSNNDVGYQALSHY